MCVCVNLHGVAGLSVPMSLTMNPGKWCHLSINEEKCQSRSADCACGRAARLTVPVRRFRVHLISGKSLRQGCK